MKNLAIAEYPSECIFSSSCFNLPIFSAQTKTKISLKRASPSLLYFLSREALKSVLKNLIFKIAPMLFLCLPMAMCSSLAL
uniref:Uncharacterized protein n=1 Tax=Pararge aegeria TaxID=116150 RepID=S4PZV4_9NEOP